MLLEAVSSADGHEAETADAERAAHEASTSSAREDASSFALDAGGLPRLSDGETEDEGALASPSRAVSTEVLVALRDIIASRTAALAVRIAAVRAPPSPRALAARQLARPS